MCELHFLPCAPVTFSLVLPMWLTTSIFLRLSISFRTILQFPGSNGSCHVRTDIRMDIRVTIDILVELSVRSRISVVSYGYPWRIVRDTMDILVELSVLAYGYYYGYPSKATGICADIHTDTGARTVRPGFDNTQDKEM